MKNKIKLIKLSNKDLKELWNDEGPYSQVHLTKQVRILDDRLSRIFLVIESYINPYTYKFCKKHIKDFTNEPIIIDILNYAEYQGSSYGYVSCPYSEQYYDDKILKKAEKMLNKVQNAVIKMHKFVINHLNINLN